MEQSTAQNVFAAVVASVPLHSERAVKRAAILAELKARNLSAGEAKFIADWCMSKFGYGGGI